MPHRQLFRLSLFVLEEQLADLRQVLSGAVVRVVVGPAAPERVLVELIAVFRRVAEDHGPEPAVTDGQSLRPLPGRRIVPKAQSRLRIAGGQACDTGDLQDQMIHRETSLPIRDMSW
jgi:hypothetical protein